MVGAESSPTLTTPAPVRAEGGLHKHQQLRDYVIARIEAGQLKAGDALPPEKRLAKQLEVARSTVRQALANLEREGIVRKVHGKGTYIRDEARQRLKKGHDLFALIVPETDNGYYPALQISFEEAASRCYAQVVVCNSNNEIDKQGNSILQLMDLHVAGVAIVPTTNPPTPAFHIRQLRERGIPVVCCSRPVEGVQVPLLSIPFEEIGKQAGTLIREAGHRKVLFISGFQSAAAKAYETGFQQALGNRIELATFFGSNSSPDLARQEAEIDAEIRRCFSDESPPTAIFATFDSLAEVIYLALGKLGLRVPEDVSLVSFGGTRRQGALASRLTAITVDELQMGATAIQMLEQMRTGELPLDTNEVRVMPLAVSPGVTLAGPRERPAPLRT
ncbi:substrate-binding domain-containing protein [Planctomicrobium sp. SH664]|uniref:LacI family DNA-binding transcriptional regulator n=1 Tax=Planctomicrobium sp. SH664 TaxID=3448125 RepID=UPI003F5AF616